jgi:cell division septation protein DedD
MDEALKARLIGAVVLVALAVLLIPELLSGRKPAESVPAQADGARGTRTFTIELGGPSLPPAATAPAPAAAATRERVPAPVPESVSRATSGPQAAAPQPGQSTPQQAAPEQAVPEWPGAATSTVAAAKAPAPAQAGDASAPAQAIPARGGWAVQVGAFGSTETANKLVAQLQASGYRAYVSPVSRAGKALYRVRVGPEAERPRAESLVPGLEARGLPATVVAND